MAMTKRESRWSWREKANPHDQERERQSTAMTKRERETVDGHDQEREREPMVMARESKSPRPRERETVDGHDQEGADGHVQERE